MVVVVVVGSSELAHRTPPDPAGPRQVPGPELTELSLWQSPPIEALIYSKEIFIPPVIVMLIRQPDPRPGRSGLLSAACRARR